MESSHFSKRGVEVAFNPDFDEEAARHLGGAASVLVYFEQSRPPMTPATLGEADVVRTHGVVGGEVVHESTTSLAGVPTLERPEIVANDITFAQDEVIVSQFLSGMELAAGPEEG